MGRRGEHATAAPSLVPHANGPGARRVQLPYYLKLANLLARLLYRC